MTHRQSNRPQLKLPPAWCEAPCFGYPPLVRPGSTNHPPLYLNVIPSKVPLSLDYAHLMPAEKQYTLRSAVDLLEKQGMPICLVLDLTNSSRFYNFESEIYDAEKRGIIYRKVRCRGRGQSPQPAEVNEACFEIWRSLQHTPNKFVLVHCTHGYNRTGFVIVCALIRMMGEQGMTVTRGVRAFAECRRPGIYKDGYLGDLCSYHHEKRRLICPEVPAWRGELIEEDDDGEGAGGEEEGPKALQGPLCHDKIFEIGEAVHPEEAQFVLKASSACILPERPDIAFPGSQPVSLDRRNLVLLGSYRYRVTWKADGTRYMLFISTQGCFLIDRSGNVARVQMRFPTKQIPHKIPQKGQRAEYPVGPPHRMTLLDGEMVVDHDKATDTFTRRYLVYDIMSLNGMPKVQAPFVERYNLIEEEVTRPRDREKMFIMEPYNPVQSPYSSPPLGYFYDTEPFKIRRKSFYPLNHARKLINDTIPNLSHESDGLILQPADQVYIPLTCDELLKWKFAHLNSVDFKLNVTGNEAGEQVFELMLMDGNRRGGQGTNYQTLVGVEVHFPEGVDPVPLHHRIIECCWDKEVSKWAFMRVREDKNEPNAAHVYSKVVESIHDDIGGEELLAWLENYFVLSPAYEADRMTLTPEQMPVPPPLPTLAADGEQSYEQMPEQQAIEYNQAEGEDGDQGLQQVPEAAEVVEELTIDVFHHRDVPMTPPWTFVHQPHLDGCLIPAAASGTGQPQDSSKRKREKGGDDQEGPSYVSKEEWEERYAGKA